VTRRSLRRGNWSVTELERLRELLPRRGVADAARLLRRSPDSVARKALALLRRPARRGAWTVEDDARLREAWGAVEPRLLGPMLGRSSAEVHKRAAELRRLLRSGPWERPELALLKEVYGTRADADLEVVLARPRAEIELRAAELCLAKDKRFAARMAAGTASASPGRPAAGGVRAMPRWTAAEVDHLRTLYPEHDNLVVAKALGRTVTGVANKANQLGLKKSPTLLATIGRQNVGLRYQRPEPAAVLVPVGPARPMPTAAPAADAAGAAARS
jgi:hypothetical protein